MESEDYEGGSVLYVGSSEEKARHWAATYATEQGRPFQAREDGSWRRGCDTIEIDEHEVDA